jgi:hypothetical protein
MNYVNFFVQVNTEKRFLTELHGNMFESDIFGNVASLVVSVMRSQVYMSNHPVFPRVFSKSFALISSTEVAKNDLNSREEGHD